MLGPHYISQMKLEPDLLHNLRAFWKARVGTKIYMNLSFKKNFVVKFKCPTGSKSTTVNFIVIGLVISGPETTSLSHVMPNPPLISTRGGTSLGSGS